MSPKLRELLVEYNNLNNPDGSAILCQGNTVVQAYVYGPAEVSSLKEKSEKASLFVYFKPKNSFNKNELRMELYESYVRSILESVVYLDLHPRTSISVIMQEMQDDGCLLSTAVNAACCALIDAGIPMKSMIASVTGYFNGDEINLDPCKEEIDENPGSSIVLTFGSVENKIISITNSGDLTIEQIKKAIRVGSAAAIEINNFYHASMRKRFLLK